MLFLNENDLRKIGPLWNDNIKIIEKTIRLYDENQCVQPIKPYLRFGEEINRIIAMPAFVGGDINFAGIKWIASFPNNIKSGIPRAHSVVILNDSSTGRPTAIINGGLLSGIRTAAVSGLMIKHYLYSLKKHDLNVGIIGWGPIGCLHFEMITDIFMQKIKKIYIYDLLQIQSSDIKKPEVREKAVICGTWRQCYDNSDIFITCTVARERYINERPKAGALLLNVSLRDFEPEIMKCVTHFIVDDWDEVCRENTDIEVMSIKYGLRKQDIKTLADVVCRGSLRGIDADSITMLNPMGMAVFDISVAANYYKIAVGRKIGTSLSS